MNHKVEHDVHVERTRREHAEPVYLEKHGSGDQRECGLHGRIETLEVADLNDATTTRGRSCDLVCFAQRRSDWLFNEEIDAGSHQFLSDRVVLYSWNRDRCGT